jgi:hypothetical protein
MHTVKAVICSGTPAKRRKNKTAAVAVAAPLCSAHATSAVRPGGLKTVKKKKKTKKTTVMKSAMSGTDLVCAAAFSSAIEPVAVAAVAAKVAAVVEPDPLDMIFAAGMEAKRDAKKKRQLEEQEAQEAQVKEAENMARRPSHSRVVDPIFFEEYDLAEKIDPQRAQVHRVRRRAKSGESPSRGRTQAGYKSPFEASWWTRRVSRRALGPQ